MIGQRLNKPLKEEDWKTYSILASWCNTTGKGHIEDMGDYYEVVRNVTDEKGIEVAQLESWFEDYDLKVKKHERCVRLGLASDISDLDKEAVIKAKRLKELRNENL